MHSQGSRDGVAPTDDLAVSAMTQGPFALSGPSPAGDHTALPLRGDIAHIALAGRFFVPHYAVPQPRAVLPGGAPLRTGMSDDAAELCTLLEGDSFAVLDVVGDWAWGCLTLAGPSGFVRLDRLEPVAQ